jgi:hypothetical protein
VTRVKPPAKRRNVSVRLTERQYEALRAYTTAIDATMSGYLRAEAIRSIPPGHWPPEPTLPGQMTLDEATR